MMSVDCRSNRKPCHHAGQYAPERLVMKFDPANSPLRDQTEKQARLAMLAACAKITQGNLGPLGFVCLGQRWARSGAQGVLTTPTSPAHQVDSWQLDDIRWHPLTPPPVPPMLWPGEQARPDKASNETWTGLFRGLLEENAAVQTILLVAPPYASALACLPRIHTEGLLPFHPAVAAFSPDGVPCAPFIATGSSELDQQSLEAVLPALAVSQACLLANQGMLVTGHSICQAVNLAQCLEGLAHIYGVALQMGEPALLDANQLDLGFRQWQQPV